MFSFFHRPLQRNLFVFAVIFLLHGLYAWRVGVKMSADSVTYQGWATQLLNSNFDFGALRDVNPLIPARAYRGFILVAAVCKVLFGVHWTQAIVLLNLVAESLTGMLLVHLSYVVTKQHLAALGSLALYLISFDIFGWTPFVLSDITFLLLTWTLFMLIATCFLSPDSRRTAWPWLIGLLMVLFFRPTGIVMIPVVVIAFVLWRKRDQWAEVLQNRPRLPVTFFGISGVLAILITFAHAVVMKEPERWTYGFVATVQFQAQHYAMGEIVFDRPETFHAPPVTLLDYVAITADRFLHYFYFVLGSFSFRHNLLHAIFFVPTYLLAIFGIASLFRRNSFLSWNGKTIGFLSLGCVLSFAFFHALLQVDYDWRYRLPIMPHLIFLASLGIAYLQEMLKNRRMDTLHNRT